MIHAGPCLFAPMHCTAPRTLCRVARLHRNIYHCLKHQCNFAGSKGISCMGYLADCRRGRTTPEVCSQHSSTRPIADPLAVSWCGKVYCGAFDSRVSTVPCLTCQPRDLDDPTWRLARGVAQHPSCNDSRWIASWYNSLVLCLGRPHPAVCHGYSVPVRSLLPLPKKQTRHLNSFRTLHTLNTLHATTSALYVLQPNMDDACTPGRVIDPCITSQQDSSALSSSLAISVAFAEDAQAR